MVLMKPSQSQLFAMGYRFAVVGWKTVAPGGTLLFSFEWGKGRKVIAEPEGLTGDGRGSAGPARMGSVLTCILMPSMSWL